MKSVLLLVLVSACASTTGVMDRDVAPRTGVELSLVPAADAVRVIPAAIDPRLPRVDRMATQIRYEIGSTVTAELSLCVSPAGNVTDVALARTTGLSELDTAIIDDVRAWQFAELPGDESLRTCQRTTLAYRVR
ncbi:MAG: energy transducer TonB [Kofleriaceae bacterium]